MFKKLLLFLLFNVTCQAYKALVVVPIADLLGQSSKTIEKIDPEMFYANLLPSTEFKTCYRIHQLLFHEKVEVIKEDGKEILVEVPNIFFSARASRKASPDTAKADKYFNKFWTLKKNILPLDKIRKTDLTKIPEMNSFREKSHDKNYVTLLKPFRVFNNQLILSTGTKFVIKEKLENGYKVFVFKPKLKKFEEIFIPNKYILRRTANKISDFLRILKSWIRKKNNIIPYVWGGSSFCNTFTKDCESQEFHDRFAKRKIKPGMDCSGLVYRAAQMANLPYYFRNTRTLSEHLKFLDKNERIENGDLIFFKGHVLVVSDVKKDLCIEARGYSHGYGFIQEIPLNREFKGIDTFTELKKKYFNNESLERLNSEGKVIKIVSDFKVLKLKSCFDWKYN